MKEEQLTSLTRFVFELGQLKRTPRSGWLKLGVDRPESVADHSFRTAAIGFLLAKLEGEDPYEVAGYCLFHDLAETRTLDLDWLAQHYLTKTDYISSDVLRDQLIGLPEKLRSSLDELLNRPDSEGNLERVARDADLLDLMFQALELSKNGTPRALNWFYNTLPVLKTDAGKNIGKFLRRKEDREELDSLISWWEEKKVNPGRDS